jgi:hypothetical protein
MRGLIVAASPLMVLAASAAWGAGPLFPRAELPGAIMLVDSGTMTVIADKTAVTERPDPKTKVVGQLKSGEQVTVFDISGNWAHIHSKASNVDGYVQKSALQ